MLQALLSPDLPELIGINMLPPGSCLPDTVLEHFRGHPNRFISIDANTKIETIGRGPGGSYDDIQEHEIPTAVREIQKSMMLASSKAEWEEDANLAKKEGREPRFKGFDGVRLVITDIQQRQDGTMVIEVAKSTYSFRAAVAKVAAAVQAGQLDLDSLIVNDQVCQANEFHAGSIMFLDSGHQVAQVKGLADGSQKIHLHLSGGGVELMHLESANAVSEGNEAEIREEVGNVARLGLKAYVIGKGDERLKVSEDIAITNYAGIIHELRGPDSSRISRDEMIALADQQFRNFSQEKLPSGELKGVHLWEVVGYPLIDYRNPSSFTIENGQLFVAGEVIRPSFGDDGKYDKALITKEKIEVQSTIAPQVVYYAQYFEENIAKNEPTKI